MNKTTSAITIFVGLFIILAALIYAAMYEPKQADKIPAAHWPAATS